MQAVRVAAGFLTRLSQLRLLCWLGASGVGHVAHRLPPRARDGYTVLGPTVSGLSGTE